MPGTTAPARGIARKRVRLAAAGRRQSAESAGPLAEAVEAEVGRDAVTVRLSDGRAVSFPIAWSPRLLHAMPDELAEVEVSPYGVHWPQLNADISVRGILAGRPGTEEPESIEAWRALMDRRRAQIAAGEEPESLYPTLPLPDWWDDENGPAPSVTRTAWTR